MQYDGSNMPFHLSSTAIKPCKCLSEVEYLKHCNLVDWIFRGVVRFPCLKERPVSVENFLKLFVNGHWASRNILRECCTILVEYCLSWPTKRGSPFGTLTLSILLQQAKQVLWGAGSHVCTHRNGWWLLRQSLKINQSRAFCWRSHRFQRDINYNVICVWR